MCSHRVSLGGCPSVFALKPRVFVRVFQAELIETLCFGAQVCQCIYLTFDPNNTFEQLYLLMMCLCVCLHVFVCLLVFVCVGVSVCVLQTYIHFLHPIISFHLVREPDVFSLL